MLLYNQVYINVKYEAVENVIGIQMTRFLVSPNAAIQPGIYKC